MKKLIIAIVVLLIVGYGGYRVYHHYSFQQQQQKQAAAQKVAPTVAKPSPTQVMVKNAVYTVMSKGKLGKVMTDEKGMTLYTYAKDTTGVSNCSGQCLANWPAYIAPAGKITLPTDVSVIKRTDGMTQFAYKGMPLYYFVKDKDSGDAYGDGVGGVWSVVKM